MRVALHSNDMCERETEREKEKEKDREGDDERGTSKMEKHSSISFQHA